MADEGGRSRSVLGWARVFYLLLAIGGILWLGARHGQIGLGLFVDRSRWLLDLGIGLVVGAALSGAWAGARRVLPQARSVEEQFAEILGPMTLTEAVVLAILSSIAEEFFFRGAVQDAWGFVPGAVLFTLLHLGPGREFRIWTMFAGVAGLSLGGLVVWRGSLLAAIVAHAVVNGIGLSRLAAMSREKGGLLRPGGTEAGE